MKTRKGARPPLASLEELRLDAEVRRIRSRTITSKGEPCVLCGKRGYRHHPSYLRPQETFALCPSDHRRLHARLFSRGRCPVVLYFAARKAGHPAPYEAREWGTPQALMGMV